MELPIITLMKGKKGAISQVKEQSRQKILSLPFFNGKRSFQPRIVVLSTLHTDTIVFTLIVLHFSPHRKFYERRSGKQKENHYIFKSEDKQLSNNFMNDA